MSVFQTKHEPFLDPAEGDELVSNDAAMQTQRRLASVAYAHGRAPVPKRVTQKPKSKNTTKASLETIMAVSRKLNEVEDARAEEAEQKRAREEAEMQIVRERRWEEIKARMKARNTPLPSVRSREEEEEMEEFDAGMSNSDRAPLVTQDNRGGAVSRKRWEVVTWYQKVWYAIYNFVSYFTLAASFAPGVLYKANDPDIYYRRREYDD